jgi:hypothetical protein
MKRLTIAAALAAGLAVTAVAQGGAQKPTHDKHEADKHGQHKEAQHKEGHHTQAPAEQRANVELADGQVLKRGEALGSSPAVKLSDVLANPQKYADKTVIVEGTVKQVCQKQGCWMELTPEKGARGVRVTFGEHAFFVPFNSGGLRARAEGKFSVKLLTKEEADHLESDGANLSRDKDGEASEVSFVATGLELRK